MGQCPSEFDLIERYFSLGVPSKWPSQGIGDDCAIISIGHSNVAVTTDTLAIGTHFLFDVDPFTAGYKALAVNLSDLAAAAATPRVFFLALSLNKADEVWVERFSSGLKKCALQYGCALLGGDTTRTTFIGQERAPITMTITAMGEVQKGLMRSGAKVGDDIWVSGTLGDAYAALMLRTGVWQGTCSQYLAQRMDLPTPRVALGQFLQCCATACADVSDGFLQDLGHILERSAVGAEVNVDACAVSDDLKAFGPERIRQAQLAGGDDYELVWTAPTQARGAIEAFAKDSAMIVSRVGTITAEATLKLVDVSGASVCNTYHGFDHFDQ